MHGKQVDCDLWRYSNL